MVGSQIPGALNINEVAGHTEIDNRVASDVAKRIKNRFFTEFNGKFLGVGQACRRRKGCGFGSWQNSGSPGLLT